MFARLSLDALSGFRLYLAKHGALIVISALFSSRLSLPLLCAEQSYQGQDIPSGRSRPQLNSSVWSTWRHAEPPKSLQTLCFHLREQSHKSLADFSEIERGYRETDTPDLQTFSTVMADLIFASHQCDSKVSLSVTFESLMALRVLYGFTWSFGLTYTFWMWLQCDFVFKEHKVWKKIIACYFRCLAIYKLLFFIIFVCHV